jgi:hypothetical protein
LSKKPLLKPKRHVSVRHHRGVLQVREEVNFSDPGKVGKFLALPVVTRTLIRIDPKATLDNRAKWEGLFNDAIIE